MLMPKRIKYRKHHRGNRKGKSTRANKLDFGEYGLQALEPAWVSARQLEAARVAITKFLKKSGKVWLRVFPDKPVTKKPAETRMGKGKGAPEFWVAVVKTGRVLFELEGLTHTDAREALRLAASKLPCRTHILQREEMDYESY
jgi:large subunit ribosomal protein L16